MFGCWFYHFWFSFRFTMSPQKCAEIQKRFICKNVNREWDKMWLWPISSIFKAYICCLNFESTHQRRLLFVKNRLLLKKYGAEIRDWTHSFIHMVYYWMDTVSVDTCFIVTRLNLNPATICHEAVLANEREDNQQ